MPKKTHVGIPKHPLKTRKTLLFNAPEKEGQSKEYLYLESDTYEEFGGKPNWNAVGIVKQAEESDFVCAGKATSGNNVYSYKEPDTCEMRDQVNPGNINQIEWRDDHADSRKCSSIDKAFPHINRPAAPLVAIDPFCH
jgi:hypothetical protein